MGRLVFSTVAGWILGGLMLTAIAINFANVVGRYLFGTAIFWAEEVLVFIVIWGVSIGMAAITYNGEHLNMDLFSSRLRGRGRLLLNATVLAVLLACCVYMFALSWQVVVLFAQTGQVTTAAAIPKEIPHAALAAAFLFTAIAALVRVRSYLSGKF